MSGRPLDVRGAAFVVLPNARDVAGRSASLVIARLDAALREHDEAHVALTGGSTPGGVFSILSAPHVRDRVDWARVHFWWGDDRFVRRDDPLCNVHLADRLLFDRGDGQRGIATRPDHVHPFPTTAAIDEGRDAEWCARRYEEELRSLMPVDGAGWPRFDLVLVGVGPDGHLLSVFPGSAAFDSDAWALAIPAPTHVRPHVPRVTLNPAIVPAAGSVLAMVQGSSKAGVVEELLASGDDPRRWPAQLALRPGATWVLDAAAAAQIAGRLAGEEPHRPAGAATGEGPSGTATGGERAGSAGHPGDDQAAGERMDDRRPLERQAEGGDVDEWCSHLDQMRDVTPSAEGCEDCLRIGGRWVHLRMCMSCGHVGCCDNSPNRHATAHFHETGHPIIRSLEPGEDWAWCYVDLIDFTLE